MGYHPYSDDSLANDSVLWHLQDVPGLDDIPASSGGNEDVTLGSSLLHSGDFVTGHGSLESVDGVDLGDDDSGTVRSEGFGTTLTDITETGDDGDFTSQHDVGGSLDTVDKGLPASVLTRRRKNRNWVSGSSFRMGSFGLVDNSRSCRTWTW